MVKKLSERMLFGGVVIVLFFSILGTLLVFTSITSEGTQVFSEEGTNEGEVSLTVLDAEAISDDEAATVSFTVEEPE